MIIENGENFIYVPEENEIHEEGEIILSKAFDELSKRYSNGSLQITDKIKSNLDIIKTIKNIIKIAKKTTIKKNSKSFLERIDERSSVKANEKLSKEISSLDNYVLIEILTRIKRNDKEDGLKYYLVETPEEKDYNLILKRHLVPEIARRNDMELEEKGC